jgi:hypothetical protein
MLRFTLPSLLLLLNLTPAAGEQLKIRCDVDGGQVLVTFDTTTTNWKSELVGGSTLQEGQIRSVDEREIEFEILRPKRMQARIFYIRNEGRIYSQDGFERLVKADNCVPAA